MKHPKPDDFQPVPTWPEDHRWHGQSRRCQAWNATQGRQCMKRSVVGLDKCTHDGGKSLKGPARSNYKDGLRSKYMPKSLRPAFEQARQDPELLDLSQSIATQEAIIVDLLGSLEEGEAPTRLVRQIRSEWRRFWEATRRGDKPALERHQENIDGLLGQAATVTATIDRIQVAEDTKRKLVDTEMRRREKMRETIQIEDAVVLYRQLVQANKDEILGFPKLERADAVKLLNAIVGRLAAIAGRPDPTVADTGD